MRKLLTCLLLFLLLAPLALARQHQEPPRPVAFTHVTVIDMTGAAARPDMTVIIQRGHITALGSSRRIGIPKSAQVIDGRGKYLMPGLWDMHIHMSIIPDQAVSRDVIAPLLVAFGIVGVRDMGGDLQRIEELRSDIANERQVGPRILSPGPFVDGPQPAEKFVLPVSNDEEARRAVRKLKAQGVDFIKVQAGLSLATWQAVLDEAKKLSIPVAGHIPERISAFDVARSKQVSIEHISPVLPGDAGILMACSSKEAELRAEMLDIEQAAQKQDADRQALRQRQRALQDRMVSTYDEKKCSSLVSLLAKNNIAAVPTQIFGKRFAPLNSDDLPAEDALRFVPRSTRTRWDTRRSAIIKASTGDDYAFRNKMFEKSLALVGLLHRAGVMLLAGTDAIDGYVVPGLSLHQELALMVEAGLTPMEALKTATRNPAVFLGKLRSQGTIEKGKVADLLLLEANPLEDINNTQKISSVMTAGKLIDKAELQKILSGVEAAASKK